VKKLTKTVFLAVLGIREMVTPSTIEPDIMSKDKSGVIYNVLQDHFT
jgi:hypothetical protein